MSVLEIEMAAMGPRRWIELRGADEKQYLNDLPFSAEVDSICTKIFIVPGGRYLVGFTSESISVSDLGYTSSSDSKLIASVEPPEGEYETCLVQATPDGVGLVIYLFV